MALSISQGGTDHTHTRSYVNPFAVEGGSSFTRRTHRNWCDQEGDIEKGWWRDTVGEYNRSGHPAMTLAVHVYCSVLFAKPEHVRPCWCWCMRLVVSVVVEFFYLVPYNLGQQQDSPHL